VVIEFCEVNTSRIIDLKATTSSHDFKQQTEENTAIFFKIKKLIREESLNV